MNGINQRLSVVVCDDALDAASKGYNYSAWDPQPTPLNIDKVVVVQKGTNAGASTVDLVLVDADGNSYVTMVTGNLLKMLPL